MEFYLETGKTDSFALFRFFVVYGRFFLLEGL